MNKRFVVLAAGAMFCLPLLEGCGPDLSTPYVRSQVAEGPLGGNWLLAGTLPQDESANYGLTVTLDEFSDTVTAYPTASYSCSSSTPADINVSVASATLGPNGGFDLVSPTETYMGETYYGMSLDATSSTTGPADWTGSFTNQYPGTDCTIPASGSFTATPIALLSGSYTGTVVLTSPTNTLGLQTPVTVSLQQGGIDPATNEFSYLIVTGTISVGSGACETSGTMVGSSPGYMSGASATLYFAMNDGSSWSMDLLANDVAISKMNLDDLEITNTACGFTQGNQGATFVKQ